MFRKFIFVLLMLFTLAGCESTKEEEIIIDVPGEDGALNLGENRTENYLFYVFKNPAKDYINREYIVLAYKSEDDFCYKMYFSNRLLTREIEKSNQTLKIGSTYDDKGNEISRISTAPYNARGCSLGIVYTYKSIIYNAQGNILGDTRENFLSWYFDDKYSPRNSSDGSGISSYTKFKEESRSNLVKVELRFPITYYDHINTYDELTGEKIHKVNTSYKILNFNLELN